MPDLNSACDIRRASAEDAGRIGAIARAAYTKYIARIGREPSPMAADFAAQIVANRVVVDARRRWQSSLRALGAG